MSRRLWGSLVLCLACLVSVLHCPSAAFQHSSASASHHGHSRSPVTIADDDIGQDAVSAIVADSGRLDLQEDDEDEEEDVFNDYDDVDDDDDDDEDDGDDDEDDVVEMMGSDGSIRANGAGVVPSRGSRRRRSAMDKRLEELERQVSDIKAQLRTVQGSDERCPVHSCPVGSMKYGCHCLLYVHRALSWLDAADHCGAMTGWLVSVMSKTVHRHIKTFLKAQLGRRGLSKARVYTGLIHTHPTSALPAYTGGGLTGGGRADGWYWQGLGVRTRLQPDDYSDWAPGHPHGGGEDAGLSAQAFPESCMHLEGSSRLQWVASHCSQRNTFVCHFKAVPSRPHKHRHAMNGRRAETGGRGGRTGRRGGKGKKKTRRTRKQRSVEDPWQSSRQQGGAVVEDAARAKARQVETVEDENG